MAVACVRPHGVKHSLEVVDVMVNTVSSDCAWNSVTTVDLAGASCSRAAAVAAACAISVFYI